MDLAMVHDPESRECFIEDILMLEYGRPVKTIYPLGRDSNNYVYLIFLQKDYTPGPYTRPRRPGTVELPLSQRWVILRISNPSAMVNEDVRVENEVAAISLMREALKGQWDHIIPKVYGWDRPGDDFGWMVLEYLEGEPLDEHFGKLEKEVKREIIGQIASIYKLIQSYKLPDSVTGYGGLAFDEDGQVVSGETTIPCGGPFETLPEMYSQLLRMQLKRSEDSPSFNGWRSSGLHRKLFDFISWNKLAKLVQNNHLNRPTIVHGDFNTWNLLFDLDSNKITGLVDFEFAHIASPADEFFNSFSSFGSMLAGHYQQGDECMLRACLLEGFDGNLPPELARHGRVDWDIAVMMNDALRQEKVVLPADIPGCGELASVRQFLGDVFPPTFAAIRSDKDASPQRKNGQMSVEDRLVNYLLKWN